MGRQVSSAVVHMTAKPATRSDVCAIVVTYNPDGGFPSRLAALHRQVGEVIIVDNSSHTSAIDDLGRLPADLNISLVQNHENRGVATALNQGLSLAVEHGFDWALLLDQDTTPTVGIADHLLESRGDFPDPLRLAIVGSNYFHGATGLIRWPQESFGTLSWIERKVVITSGSLVSLDAYQAIGPFRDEYFVDCVDLEYCLRARSKGFKIVLTKKPLMTHDFGESSRHRLLWREIAAPNYSPIRRYYMVRNHVALAKEYLFKEPLFVMASLGALTKSLMTSLLFESGRLAKVQFAAIGFLDGCVAKFDRTVG